MEVETAGEIWCEALHAHRLNSIWGFWGNCQHFEKQVLGHRSSVLLTRGRGEGHQGQL